jgi:hypothetical protein
VTACLAAAAAAAVAANLVALEALVGAEAFAPAQRLHPFIECMQDAAQAN